jgi:DNA-binding NtrC family response regulator
VPSLRDRRADIPELCAYFLDRHRGARHLGVSEAAMQALVAYDWPGNVRELERLMERAVALTRGETIDLADLPSSIQGDYPQALLPSLQRAESLRVWAGRYVQLVLERCHGNKRAASRALEISNHTLNAHLRANARRLAGIPRAARKPNGRVDSNNHAEMEEPIGVDS